MLKTCVKMLFCCETMLAVSTVVKAGPPIRSDSQTNAYSTDVTMCKHQTAVDHGVSFTCQDESGMSGIYLHAKQHVHG